MCIYIYTYVYIYIYIYYTYTHTYIYIYNMHTYLEGVEAPREVEDAGLGCCSTIPLRSVFIISNRKNSN